MDTSASPLVQQARPSFLPKIVSLYEKLFKDNTFDAEKAEGFWTEFFLLKCHPPGMRTVMESLSGDDLLHLQPQTRQLFSRAVRCIKKGDSPSDEAAFDTLTVFLSEVLSKRYTNFSSDVIAILAGLDRIDDVFGDFVGVLDSNIRRGSNVDTRFKAVHLALVTACGAFQTGLLSYFTHRDLFPALMKFIGDPTTSPRSYEAFVLLGVLANYNKFELQNPYQLRLADFVNEQAINQIVNTIGIASAACREDYILIQDDVPEGWTFGSMLNFVGLSGILAAGTEYAANLTRFKGSSVAKSMKGLDAAGGANGEEAKITLSKLPGPRAAILLAAYDFVSSNKFFSFTFVSLQPTESSSTSTATAAKVEPPIAAFLSLTSYLLHHAHRSSRSALYARLNLLMIRILVEDTGICKRLTGDDLKTGVRICRQRQPFLPVVKGGRTLMAATLDVVVDGINHNLKKKLDVDLYSLLIGILLRIITFLSKSRIRLSYHWAELWKSLVSLIRFFASYADDLRTLSGLDSLLDTLVNTIALSLSSGDAFLPSATEYDDLFYKLVETGDTLVKFRDSYGLSDRSTTNSINTLVSVSEHYYKLIEENTRGRSGGGGSRHLSPQQVSEVIKNGYETLSITGLKDGLENWEKYREADERSFLKKTARVAVKDAMDLVQEGG